MTLADPITETFTPNTEGIFFGLSAEDYHSAPGVSQSMLKEFGSYPTPLHFKARKPKEPTEDMEFGTICHTAILEPKKLPDAYWLRPDTYPAETSKGTVGKKWNGNSDWCQKWLEDHSNRPIIKRDKLKLFPRIIDRVMGLTAFATALSFGQREVSHFAKDPVTGLLLKCRPDLMATAIDGETWIFDLKKVQSGGASPTEFQKSIIDYGYHIQAAAYLQITGASRFVFVLFDDDEPFDAAEYEPDEEMLEFGRLEFRRLLNAYAFCVESDQWPGYADGIQKIGLPGRVKKKAQ